MTWACLRYVQGLANILDPQNGTQGRCDMYSIHQPEWMNCKDQVCTRWRESPLQLLIIVFMLGLWIYSILLTRKAYGILNADTWSDDGAKVRPPGTLPSDCHHQRHYHRRVVRGGPLLQLRALFWHQPNIDNVTLRLSPPTSGNKWRSLMGLGFISFYIL